MDRRSFVKSGINIAALSLFPGTLGAVAAERPVKPKIKIGFLGVSHSHARGKLKVVQELSDFELIGISEESQKAHEPYGTMDVKFLSPDQLFDACAVVAVESAVRDHAQHAKLALQAGKHVHLEKPPADNLKEFQELVSLAQTKRLLLQTGYMWRYHPGFMTAMEAAKQGWLGKVYLVRATMNSDVAADRRSEWAEFKGGAMFELGSHLIDAAVRLLGRPKNVTPLLKNHGEFNDELADNTVAVLEFSDATAIITSSTLQPNAGEHRFFEILGTNGTVLLQPIEPGVLRIDLAKPAGPYVAGNQTVPLRPYRRYETDFTELAKAVRGEQPLSVSLPEELLVHETLMRVCAM
jgi:predicted dehydrogenase